MISLKNKPNVIAPTSQYPHGRLKDDTGVGDGTPIEQLTNNDIHSFFQELMAEANLSPNEILDNEYDGFQLNTALGLLINKYILAALPIKLKILNLGDWNMQSNSTLAVNHGLSFKKIVIPPLILIYNDAADHIYPLDSFNAGAELVDGGVINFDATQINVYRRASGVFNSANFSATGYNRGTAFIIYIP